MSSRPSFLICVAGTNTEIGKTWVSCELLRVLKNEGNTVAARKPLQSFAATDDPAETDAALLGAASGEEPEKVCPTPHSFGIPMAPPMAAAELGVHCPTSTELVTWLATTWPTPPVDVGLVELVGGLGSPQTADADGVALIQQLIPDAVVLVADAVLGTLSQVNLSLRALREGAGGDETLAATIPHVVVYLNRFDSQDMVHTANKNWLATHTDCAVVTDPSSLSTVLATLVPRWCQWCGQKEAAVGVPHLCAHELEASRYCPKCGRRSAVLITPMGQRSRCKIHGVFGVH